MRVLVACEESQVVTKAFRRIGHEAFSCDILPCSGGRPEWHYQNNVFDVINEGWDLMIAFPPCTHLACSGARWFEKKRSNGEQKNAIKFFLDLANADIKMKAVENPVGIMSTIFREPEQSIHPYFFGDEFQKKTCLWLHNLPKLQHFQDDDLFNKKTWVDKGEMKTFKSGKVMPKWYADLRNNGGERAKTFPGLAQAMADQWGKL